MSDETERQVKLESFHKNREDLIRPILEDFAKKVGKTVYLRNVGCGYRVPYSSNEYDLGIFLFSMIESPEAGVEMGMTYSLYGVNLCSHQQKVITVSYIDRLDYRKIIAPSGDLVAVIVDRTLYILQNLDENSFYSGNQSNISKIWQAIFDDYALYFTNRAKFDRLMKSRLKAADMNNFVKLFKRTFDDADSSLSVEDYTQQINELKSTIANSVRERKKLLGEPVAEVDASLATSLYQGLCKLSTTKKISVTSDGIVTVPVGQINIEYGDQVYDIGKFVVQIDLNENEVRCINLTRTIGESCYHPHVTSSGSCCMGNISSSVENLISDLELETLVIVMIEFLKSYNRGNPYTSICNWPVKSKKKREKVTK